MEKTVGVLLLLALQGLPLTAATAGDGAEWEVPQGESVVLPAGDYANTMLTVNGSLTLDSGAKLTLSGAAWSYIGTQPGQEASLTIRSGARLDMIGTSAEADPSNASAFAVGAGGSFGTLTVEPGGELIIAKASFGLARNALASASPDRTLTSRGVLNVSGTVDVGGRFEATAWYPTLVAPYDNYDLENDFPQSAVINLNEGGVLAAHFFQFDDTARAIINCNGGTIKAKKANDNFNNAGGVQLWTIAAGKNLIVDSNGFNIRFQKNPYRDDFAQVVGEGGLVKKGLGHFAMSIPSAQNTFTGPIVVEAGSFSLGRHLAPGQTVLVKSGAVFYPSAGDDLSLITYENESERPNNALYTLNNEHWDALDLTQVAPDYGPTAIAAGPNLATARGPITVPADVDAEKPFGIVTRAGVNLNFYNTGLENYPLTLSGTGLAYFGAGCVVAGERRYQFAENASLQFNGEFVISNAVADASAPAQVTVVGSEPKTGTLKTNLMRVGHEGHGGELYITNANVAVNGELRIGGNVSVRQKFPAKVEVVNGTLSATSILLSPTCLTDGSDYDSTMASLYLGPGSTVTVADHFQRNDDPRARVVFDGGQCVFGKTMDSVIQNFQNGVFEWEAKAGANLDFSLGTNRVGAISTHTHFLGDGGFYVHGTNPTTAGFLLGARGLDDFAVGYKGDTKVENCRLVLGFPNVLPHGADAGSLVGVDGIVDLGLWEQTVNQVSGSLTVKGGTLVLGADNADLVLDPQVKFAPDAALAKVGAGTLTANQPLGGNLDVRAGTVVVKGATAKVAYASYRFKVEQIRGHAMTAAASEWNSTQLAEFKLMDGINDVTRPFANFSYDLAHDVATAFPAAEVPEKVVDGSLDTKWLDFRATPTATAADRDRVWIRLDYGKPHPITGYCWYTANDGPGRDPIAWRLQGSNDDGATWEDIDVQTDYVPTSTRRELAYASNGMGNAMAGNSSVHVNEGATLVVDGGVVALDGIDNQGTLDLRNGVTVQSRGGTLNGLVQNVAALDKVGPGALTLTGDLACSGPVHVAGGTLNVGPAPSGSTRTFDGKFFRLTVQRSNDGGGFQFSEFQLYDAEGVSQIGTLARAANGVPASLLAVGQFTVEKEYAYNAKATNPENVPQGLDGNVATKWYTSAATDGRPVNYKVIAMRLAATAKPICSYNFFTANDYVRRSPTDWVLEGSHDGVSWIELDRRVGAPHTAFDNRNNYSAAAVQKKPFNNGEAFAFPAETLPIAAARYLRFTFKKTVGQQLLQMSELRVFDTFGNNVAKGLVKAADAIAATQLTPGSFSRGGVYDEGGNGSEGFAMLFDDNPDTKLCAINNNMAGADANYRALTMRLPEGVTSVVGYDWLTANDSLNRSPCDWMVEGSLDGVTWTTLDERAGWAQPFCLYASGNHGRPFAFSKLAPGGSLAAESIQVDGGATLALNAEDSSIRNLVLDWSLGGGTLVNFRPASKGRLTIRNLRDETNLEGLVLPYTVQNLRMAANLIGWTVTIEGVVGTYDVRLNADSQLFIRRHIGLALHFR